MNPSFFHALDDLIHDVAQFLVLREIGILQHLLHQLRRKQVALLQRAQDGFAQLFHHLFARALRIHFVDSELRFEAALQQKIGKAAHQFLQINIIRGVGSVF